MVQKITKNFVLLYNLEIHFWTTRTKLSKILLKFPSKYLKTRNCNSPKFSLSSILSSIISCISFSSRNTSIYAHSNFPLEKKKNKLETNFWESNRARDGRAKRSRNKSGGGGKKQAVSDKRSNKEALGANSAINKNGLATRLQQSLYLPSPPPPLPPLPTLSMHFPGRGEQRTQRQGVKKRKQSKYCPDNIGRPRDTRARVHTLLWYTCAIIQSKCWNEYETRVQYAACFPTCRWPRVSYASVHVSGCEYARACARVQ